MRQSNTRSPPSLSPKKCHFRIGSSSSISIRKKDLEFEISLNSTVDLFENNDCTELASEERASDVTWPSSVPVKMAKMKFILLNLNLSFRTNKIDNK